MKTAVCGPTTRDLFRKPFLANTQRWFNIDIRRWDYLENFGIYTQLDRKSRTWFFYFPQCVCFLNLTGQNPNLTAFTSKKFRYFADQNRPKGSVPIKMNFDNFQMQKWVS